MKMSSLLMLFLNLFMILFGCKKDDNNQPDTPTSSNCRLSYFTSNQGNQDTTQILLFDANGNITKASIESDGNKRIENYVYNSNNLITNRTVEANPDDLTNFYYNSDGTINCVVNKFKYTDVSEVITYKDSSVYSNNQTNQYLKTTYLVTNSSVNGITKDTSYFKINFDSDGNPISVYEKMNFSGAIADTFLLTSSYQYNYNIPASFSAVRVLQAYEGSSTIFSFGKTKLLSRLETYYYNYNGSVITSQLGDLTTDYTYEFDQQANVSKSGTAIYTYNCQ